MEIRDHITNLPDCRRGQLLQGDERGVIQALMGHKLFALAIARGSGCSRTSVSNELKRRTASCTSPPQCPARRGCLQLLRRFLFCIVLLRKFKANPVIRLRTCLSGDRYLLFNTGRINAGSGLSGLYLVAANIIL